MKKFIQIQFFILLIGTIYAWSNFLNELFPWLNNRACTLNSVANGQLINPFLSSCFYEAVFFALAFILSLLMSISQSGKSKKNIKNQEKLSKNEFESKE